MRLCSLISDALLRLYQRISRMECGHSRIFLLKWSQKFQATLCGSWVTCSHAKHYYETQGCSCGDHPHAIIAFGTSLVARFTTDMKSIGASFEFVDHCVVQPTGHRRCSVTHLIRAHCGTRRLQHSPSRILLSPLQVEDDDRPSTWVTC